MLKFPTKYNIKGSTQQFKEYCLEMAKDGTPGSMLEVQVIADIMFSIIEIYFTADPNAPMDIILPLRMSRLSPLSSNLCPRTMRLWFKRDSHCVALIDD